MATRFLYNQEYLSTYLEEQGTLLERFYSSEEPPSECVADELHEAIMIHTKRHWILNNMEFEKVFVFKCLSDLLARSTDQRIEAK